MPFYIAPGGTDFEPLDNVRVGVGRLASMVDGKLKEIFDEEPVVFFAMNDHHIGVSKEELSDLIDQLLVMRGKLDKEAFAAKNKDLN